MARESAVVGFIKHHDRAQRYKGFNREALAFYDEAALERLRAGAGAGAGASSAPDGALGRTLAELSRRAQECLGNPCYSVVDKTTLPPSGDPHDYWHPAPYAWPNPDTPDGLPYVYKDGERVPGTRLYEPESIQYDRTALQRMFDESTTQP